MDKIRIGVSKCLLGEAVRYDGQHKHDHFITDTLGRYFEFVGVCPEVECGLGVPRESMRLIGDPANPRLVTTRTGLDLTARMQDWAAQRVAELEKEDLGGFIFKSRSPSSGMENVKVYNDKGGFSGKAPGMFAKAFMAHFPALPCEDEGRLNDPDLRENFIERVFALWRFRQALRASPTLATLMTFHARNKLLIQSHHETVMREMGRELAGLKAKTARAYIPHYDTPQGFPAWARRTLSDHARDARSYVYPRARLEAGETHDDLWNAAQQEMAQSGKMHSYLRMYWAKKILEWTGAPEEALQTVIDLNDRYEMLSCCEPLHLQRASIPSWS